MLGIASFGQNSNNNTNVNDSTGKEEAVEVPFMVTETIPVFPEGDAGLFKFLYSILRYPDEAFNNDIEGKVLVEFVINKAGEVSDVSILSVEAHESLQAEALRVVRSMPKWAPCRAHGKALRIKCTLPIEFRLIKSMQGTKQVKRKDILIHEMNTVKIQKMRSDIFNQQKEEILEIKHISISHNIEVSETLVITPDSIHFTKSYWEGEVFKKFQDTIPSDLWATLISKCDIRVFDGIKKHENPEMSSYEPQIFHIRTTKDEYIYVDDYELKQLRDFCEIIYEHARYYSARSTDIGINLNSYK